MHPAGLRRKNMKVDGLGGQGNGVERLGAKRPQPAPSKSFAEALKKASKAADAPPQAAPAPAKDAPPPPADDYLSTIKHRLQSGYYNTQKVDDALSDKLSGYFDEIA
jgi:hypothetical protein